ncbi:MAG: division/cell wall cluster transcriptional repressor MraZ, partial [Patescibacteria group bacterium]
MFIGEYNHNLDTKGRLAVPAKFRNMLKKGAVVTKGLDNCLFLYPKERWEKEAEKIANLPISQSKARAFSRHMLAGAMDVEFDNQGRVTLPEYLRKFAGLKKKAVIAG